MIGNPYDAAVRVRRRVILGLAGFGLWTASLLGGCGGDAPTRPEAGADAAKDPSSSAVRPATDQSPDLSPRIVSLSPAISRTLVDLGMGDAIVARTPYCDSVPASVPVAGTHLDFDAERLVSVAPTHLLVQAPAQGVDPALTSLATERGIALKAWRLERVSEVAALVRALPAAIGASSDARLVAKADATADDLDALAARAAAPSQGGLRALLLVTTDPLGAAGADTFLDDVARSLGWRNAVTQRGYPSLSHEDLVRLAPDLIVVVRDTAERDDATLRAQVLASDELVARYAGVFHVVRDPDALLPSSALLGVAKKLGAIASEPPR